MEAIARIYGQFKHDYGTAIEWMGKALEAMPQSLKDNRIDSKLLQCIAGWKQKLGDTSGALELARN